MRQHTCQKIGSSGGKGINNNLLLLVERFILLKFAIHLKIYTSMIRLNVFIQVSAENRTAVLESAKETGRIFLEGQWMHCL